MYLYWIYTQVNVGGVERRIVRGSGECRGWWMSHFTWGVVKVWGGERRILHWGWWMSGVVNVAIYIGGGECRTIMTMMRRVFLLTFCQCLCQRWKFYLWKWHRYVTSSLPCDRQSWCRQHPHHRHQCCPGPQRGGPCRNYDEGGVDDEDGFDHDDDDEDAQVPNVADLVMIVTMMRRELRIVRLTQSMMLMVRICSGAVRYEQFFVVIIIIIINLFWIPVHVFIRVQEWFTLVMVMILMMMIMVVVVVMLTMMMVVLLMMMMTRTKSNPCSCWHQSASLWTVGPSSLTAPTTTTILC